MTEWKLFVPRFDGEAPEDWGPGCEWQFQWRQSGEWTKPFNGTEDDPMWNSFDVYRYKPTIEFDPETIFSQVTIRNTANDSTGYHVEFSFPTQQIRMDAIRWIKHMSK